MISIDLDALAKALAPLLAAELEERLSGVAGRGRLGSPLMQHLAGPGESTPNLLRSPEEIIDRHGAREFGLSGDRFTQLAKAGAFPSLQLDRRGRVGAYRRDLQAWLEQQRWTNVPASPRASTPKKDSKPEAKPLSKDLDDLVVRALNAGKLRVIPGRAGKGSPPSAQTTKNRRSRK